MVKKKKESMMDLAKQSVGIGIVGGAGLGAMGAMSNIHGMPAQASGVTRAAGAGIQLAAVGQTAKIGLSLTGMFGGGEKKKKSGNKYVDKII